MTAILTTIAVILLAVLCMYQLYLNLLDTARTEQEERFNRQIKEIIKHCERPTVHIECRGYEVDEL